MFERKKSLMLFLLPGLAGVLLFYAVPFLGGMAYSFTDGHVPFRWVGLANYRAVWSNRMFLLGLKNSLLLSVMCAPTVWLLGFLLAALLCRLKGSGNALRNSILLPYVMPSTSVLLIWLMLFDYGGPINRLITALGCGRVFFLSGEALRLPVLLLFVWKNLGFAVIVFLSAMQAVPDAYYEYAALEGAGFLRQCVSITLPCILPTCFLMLILAWVSAFKIFKEVYLIGGAYPDEAAYTLQNYMNNLYGKLNYPHVSTAAYTFAGMLFLFFGLLFFIQHRSTKAAEGE